MKKVLYVIIGLLIVYLILAFVGPKQIKVERQISINKPASLVKEKLGDFKFFHENWSPWTEKDPNMETSYSGNPGEIGHKHSWSGNKEVGKGSMEIVGYMGDTIMQKLSFEGQGDSKAYYILKDNASSTDVTWGMSFDVGFMGRPVMLFMNMDKMIGSDFEKGLAKLKSVTESLPDASASKYEVTEVNWEATTYIGKKETVSFDKMSDFFMKNMPLLFTELGKNKIEPMSAPSGIYTNYNEKEKKSDVAVAAKVADGTTLKGWETFAFPASKVLQVTYYGAYEKIMDAHMAMEAYMKEKGITSEVSAVEEYITDPMKEKDTTKWQTNIYYILK